MSANLYANVNQSMALLDADRNTDCPVWPSKASPCAPTVRTPALKPPAKTALLNGSLCRFPATRHRTQLLAVTLQPGRHALSCQSARYARAVLPTTACLFDRPVWRASAGNDLL